MQRYARLLRPKTEGLPENIAFLIRRHLDCTIGHKQVLIPIIKSRDGICFPLYIPVRLLIVMHHTARHNILVNVDSKRGELFEELERKVNRSVLDCLGRM